MSAQGLTGLRLGSRVSDKGPVSPPEESVFAQVSIGFHPTNHPLTSISLPCRLHGGSPRRFSLFHTDEKFLSDLFNIKISRPHWPVGERPAELCGDGTQGMVSTGQQ